MSCLLTTNHYRLTYSTAGVLQARPPLRKNRRDFVNHLSIPRLEIIMFGRTFISALGRTFSALTLLSVCVGSASFLHAQTGPVTVEELRRYVRYLASDELEGRRTGTNGNLLAAGYIAGTFAEHGLAPVNGAYFHYFPYLARVNAGPKNSLKLTMPGRISDLAQGTDFTPLGFSSSGTVESDLVFVGYGISSTEHKYDDYTGVNVKGKIVVMLRYSPAGDDFHDPLYQLSTFPAKVMTAKEKGAAGIIVLDVNEDEAELIPLSLNRGFTDAGLPIVSVLPSLFRDLRDSQGRDLMAIRKMIDQDKRPNSFAMIGYRAAMTVDVTLEKVNAPNVLGMVPGNDPKLKDEIIILGGHFDHLGHGGEGSLHGHSDPAIHNGADDNASGTAGVMALARHFAETRSNRRTLIFMAFNGEEEGLLGSAAMMETPPFTLDKVVTMINMDMIGRLSGDSLIMQGTGTSPQWDALIGKINTPGLTISKVKDGFGPSDHSSFYSKQIPVLFFFTGLHSDYHRPSDDWELVNYEGMRKVLEVAGNAIREIDGMSGRPTYTEVPRTVTAQGTRFRVVLGVIPDYGYGEKGLRLTGVSDGGAAKTAGLQGGDIIVKMAGKEIQNIETYTVVLSTLSPGEEVEVVYLRDDKEHTVSMKPGKAK